MLLSAGKEGNKTNMHDTALHILALIRIRLKRHIAIEAQNFRTGLFPCLSVFVFVWLVTLSDCRYIFSTSELEPGWHMGTLAVLPFLAQKGNQTNYQRPLFFFKEESRWKFKRFCLFHFVENKLLIASSFQMLLYISI